MSDWSNDSGRQWKCGERFDRLVAFSNESFHQGKVSFITEQTPGMKCDPRNKLEMIGFTRHHGFFFFPLSNFQELLIHRKVRQTLHVCLCVCGRTGAQHTEMWMCVISHVHFSLSLGFRALRNKQHTPTSFMAVTYKQDKFYKAYLVCLLHPSPLGNVYVKCLILKKSVI